MRHTGAFCRAIAHSWHMVGGAIRFSSTLTQLNLECTNCGTTRRDLWDRRGRVARRKYVYSDGYLRLRGEGRPPKRHAYRVEYLRGRYVMKAA